MKKTIFLSLLFSLIISNSFSQQAKKQQDVDYEINQFLIDDVSHTKVKEFLVKQIRTTKLVKEIDNHDLVHFFLDRYDSHVKQALKERFKNQNSIKHSEVLDFVNLEFMPKLVELFDNYRVNFPKKNTSFTKNQTNFIKFKNNETLKGAGEPCLNADFETQDATGWDLSYGQVDPAPTAPFNYINVTPTTLGTSAQHSIMTGAGTDAIGGFPVVFPGGTSSLMLGDGTGTNNSAADASQTFLVDANSAAFSYSYAIVLMDPGHTAAEQPYFKINMYDSLGNSIACGDYAVVAGGGSGADPDFLPFTFGSENGVYMPWRTTFAPLQGYIGQNVTIEFVVGDCSQGGHFGYAYIDASCSSMEVLGPDTITCTGPIQITAPPGAASYLWSPNGETTQTITISTPGQYEVEVTPVTGAACSITLTKDIYEFIDTVSAAFIANPLTICSGESISFSDQSTVLGIGTITSWEWDFDGDGNVDNFTQNPTFQFNTAGTFNVNLNVITQGCFDDTTMQVIVNQTPAANFSAPEVCLGLITQFTDNSLGNPTTWNWDFDNDGNSDENIQNPTFTYSSAGVYPVNLTVTDGGICSHDTTLNVIVSQNSTAIFTATNVCLGVATSFNDLSLGGVDTWNWDFDNNGIVDNTTQNPSFTFGTTGTFPVNLQVSVGSNCVHDTTINVTVTESSTANFAATTVCFGTPTVFTDNSSTGVDTWGWDFNNDGVIDNSSQNPTNNFPSSGTFPVSLQVSIAGQCAHDTIININVNDVAVANFSLPQTCQDDTAFFNDLSSAGVDTWNWDFNNDGITDNTNQNPTFIFPGTGSYPVNLEVSYGGNCSHDTTIQVTISSNPSANFTSTDECLGNLTNLLDASLGNGDVITQWAWDFDNDGIIDNTNQNPSPILPSTGLHSIELTVTTSNGCSNTFISSVNVLSPPIADFSIESNPCEATAVTFSNISLNGSGIISSWSWDFNNDGSIESTLSNPLFEFDNLSSVTILLVVEDNLGCVDTTLKTIDIATLEITESIVPNIFTPNGDNWNDKLVVGGIDVTKEYSIKIFNRWGRQMFESTDATKYWDGEDADDGTYFYELKYTAVCSTEEKLVTGTVTLLRGPKKQ